MTDSPFGKSMSRPRAPRNMLGIGLGITALAIGCSGLAYSSFYSVPAGHSAVLFSRFSGVLPNVYGEGLHFKVPYFHVPQIFNIRNSPTMVSTKTPSKDLQMVTISVRVLAKPQVSKLPAIFEELGTDFYQRVLPSVINEEVKSIVAQFNVSQLTTQRELVSKLIQNRLRDRCFEFNILLDDVSITDLAPGPEYRNAVEEKQIAQQQAERAKFIVERAEQDKRSIIIKAEGDSKSAELIGKAVAKSPYFLELRRVEAAIGIAESLAMGGNKVYLDADNLMINSIAKE